MEKQILTIEDCAKYFGCEFVLRDSAIKLPMRMTGIYFSNEYIWRL